MKTQEEMSLKTDTGRDDGRRPSFTVTHWVLQHGLKTVDSKMNITELDEFVSEVSMETKGQRQEVVCGP